MAEAEPFGATPAEFSLVGDAIVVYMAADLSPIRQLSRPKSKRVAAVPDRRIDEPPRVVAVSPSSALPEEASTTNLRGILQAIVSVEKHTVYRLARLKEGEGGGLAWAWRAPIVRLDGGEETEV
jgi:hypothetical protein